MFHHSNVKLIESLSDMSNEMSSLLSRVEQAAKKCTRILNDKSGDRNSVKKEKKCYVPEEGPGKRRRRGGGGKFLN